MCPYTNIDDESVAGNLKQLVDYVFRNLVLEGIDDDGVKLFVESIVLPEASCYREKWERKRFHCNFTISQINFSRFRQTAYVSFLGMHIQVSIVY